MPDVEIGPDLSYGFLLHDVGKVGIPESILCKPGPLTDEEYEVMKTHPLIGVQIVAPIAFLGNAVEVIRCHHERWDGRGYPDGLAGEGIPLAARIFSVCDTFDAMTSDRPYRRALPFDSAVEEIDRCGGTQFDPEVVRLFVEMCAELRDGAAAG
jgi:ribonuclease P protein subunit RPR2